MNERNSMLCHGEKLCLNACRMWNEQSSDVESGKTSCRCFRSAVESSVMKSSGPFFPRPPKYTPSNKDIYSRKAHEILFC